MKLPCQKQIPKKIGWGIKNEWPITKNGVLPRTTFFFFEKRVLFSVWVSISFVWIGNLCDHFLTGFTSKYFFQKRFHGASGTWHGLLLSLRLTGVEALESTSQNFKRLFYFLNLVSDFFIEWNFSKKKQVLVIGIKVIVFFTSLT